MLYPRRGRCTRPGGRCPYAAIAAGLKFSLTSLGRTATANRLALISRAVIWRGGVGPSMRIGGKSVGGGRLKEYAPGRPWDLHQSAPFAR